MGQQGKSYRYSKPIAPYKHHIASNGSSRASSFFKRMKSFFNNDQSIYRSRDQVNGSGRDSNEDDSPRIPGGFFSADASKVRSNSQPVVLKRHGDDRSIFSNITQNVAEGDSEDDFDYGNTSNAKLADFFRKKGDEPLTDIEMEGVLSLMKKANRSGNAHKRPVINTSADDSMALESSRVLKSSRTPSMAASSYKAPSFTPRYDDSVGSQSLANASLRSTSSRRRVFDYSSFPTPYKTVVYKYSAADSGSAKRNSNSAVAFETSSSDLDLPSKSNNAPTQKLSNTASALVSLLDGTQTTKPTSAYSNPYSSYIDPIREYKKSASVQPVKGSPTPSNTVRSDALEKIQDAKKDSDSQVLPKQRQKLQHKAPSDKYKPVRSSSLRSSIVPAGEVIENVDNQAGTKPTVPTAARFDFTLKENTKEKAQAEQERFQNAQVSQPLFSSQVQPNDTAKPSKQEAKSRPTIEDGKKEQVSFPFSSAKQATIETGNTVKSESQGKVNSFSLKSSETESEKFDLGEPSPSGVNPNLLDGAKVENFKLAFIFD